MQASRFFLATRHRISGYLAWLGSWRLVREPWYSVEQRDRQDRLVNLISRPPFHEEVLQNVPSASEFIYDSRCHRVSNAR